MSSISILPTILIHKLQQLNVKREHIAKYIDDPNKNTEDNSNIDISGNLQNN